MALAPFFSFGGIWNYWYVLQRRLGANMWSRKK